MVYGILKISIALLIAGILSGCGQGQLPVDTRQAKLSAWLTYWDLHSGGKELESIAAKLEKLSYFGAYFDQNDRLFIPKELLGKKNSDEKTKGKYEAYLTFVNDKLNADGSSVLKDIEVLRRVFADDTAMERHIDEMVALTLQGGFDGIEVDYERVWNDGETGQLFLKFIDQLYAKAVRNNLKVRIVLEPGAPFASNGFFTGPEYVVMLYHLYGVHSGPGPKADRAFIKKILTQMKALPGEKSAAFSTGGCIWRSNGEKRFLTEVEAKTLAVTYEAEIQRDEQSQCLFFRYQEQGGWQEVWYADVQTLNAWIALAKEQGINHVSLWRLGGNVDIGKTE